MTGAGTGTPLTLHGYWRSGAAWRVRIALNLKELDYVQVPHDLRTGARADGKYLALNPQGLVPALECGDTVITQSLAILEWLEECFPTRALLPADHGARAQVRSVTQIIASDIHPLNNLRVLTSLRRDLGTDEGQIRAWIARWIEPGFSAIETMLGRRAGAFAFGASPTLADCCLVPQVYSARRFGVELAAFPRIVAVDDHCASLPAFQKAHPSNQPDAD